MLLKQLEEKYNDNNSDLTVEQNVHNRHHGLGNSVVGLDSYNEYLLYGSHYRRYMQINVADWFCTFFHAPQILRSSFFLQLYFFSFFSSVND